MSRLKLFSKADKRSMKKLRDETTPTMKIAEPQQQGDIGVGQVEYKFIISDKDTIMKAMQAYATQQTASLTAANAALVSENGQLRLEISTLQEIVKYADQTHHEENERLREALQNIADSTDGNNPNDAVFYFTATNALNPKTK